MDTPIMRRRAGRLGALAVLALAAGAVAASAQPPPFARPFRESVSVPADLDAEKALRTLQDRWELGQWSDSLDALLELMETKRDALVPVERGRSGGVARYLRLADACAALLSELPPEGLAAYRRRIDPSAEQWWEEWQRSGDSENLDRIVDHAFFSRRGDDALWELGRQAWSRGDFAAARTHWERLRPAADEEFPATSRPRYPDPQFPPAEVAARLVLCRIAASEADAAERELVQFAARFGDVQGTLGGREGRLADLLSDLRRQASAWPAADLTTEVPTYAGSPSRNHVADRPVDVGPEVWSAPLPPQRLPEQLRPLVFHPSPSVCYAPAIADDLVLVNDGARIRAWNLFSGQPAWLTGGAEADVIYPPVASDDVPQPARMVAGAALWTVTVSDGRLFARMGSAVTTPAPLELRELPNELVCLDLRHGQGRLLWKKAGDDLPAPDRANELPAWSWEGSPLVDRGRVYAALSRRRPQLEWSVVCLDAETGLLLWHQLVGINRPTLPEHENRASQLLLTLGDGQVYLSTDAGQIAALDAADGRLAWIVTYESEPVFTPLSAPADRTPAAPGVYADRRLYVAPADCSRVLCLDSATGAVVWQRERPERLQHLLGIAQERLFVSGRSLWAFGAARGNLAWSLTVGEPEQAGYGRGALAGDVIYWTSREDLKLVDQRTGRVLLEQPLRLEESPRSGGNVVISQGIVLIAGADRLTAYGPYARVKQDLQERLSVRPNDWRSRLALAEWESAHADRPAALAHQQAALSGAEIVPERFWAERARESLIRTFVQDARRATSVESIRRFCLQALQIATPGPQRLRVLRAERQLAQARADPAWLADVLQRQLSESVDVAVPEIGAEPCRLLADLVNLAGEHGWSVLEETERRAADRLTVAEQRRDAAGLVRVVQTSPLSAAAVTAGKRLLADASQRAVLLSAWPSAARLISGCATPPAEVSDRLKSWANALAAAGAQDAARQVTDALQQLRQRAARRVVAAVSPTAAHSETAAPVACGYWRRVWRRDIPPDCQVFVAETRDPGPSASLLSAGQRLAAWDRATGAERWSTPLDAPVIWAGQSTDDVFVATRWDLSRLAATDGRTRWRTRFPDPPIEPREAQNGRWSLIPGGIVRWEAQGRCTVFDADTGAIRWTRNGLRPAEAVFSPTGNRLLTSPSNGRPAALRDMATGRAEVVLRDLRSPWRGPPAWTAADQLAWVDAERRVLGCDLQSGRGCWEFHGPAESAHVEPWLFFQHHLWHVVADGLNLSQVDERTGLPRWTRRLADVPLSAPAAQVALASDAIVCAAGGVLRCLDLPSGRLRWERSLSAAADPQRVVLLSETPGGPEVGLLVAPADGRASPPLSAVTLYSLRDGRPVQRIVLSEPTARLTAHCAAGDAVLITEHEALALQPED